MKISPEDKAWLFSKSVLIIVLHYFSILLIVGNAVVLGQVVVVETGVPVYGAMVIIVMAVVGLNTRKQTTRWAIRKMFNEKDAVRLEHLTGDKRGPKDP